MKSLIETTQNHYPKPLPCNTTTAAASNTTTPPCYEPTSVLDLRSSPASAAGGSDSVCGSVPLPDDPSLPADWDSIICYLTDKDDSAPTLRSIPQFAPPDTGNPNLPPFPPSVDCYDQPPFDFDPSPLDFCGSEPASFDRLHLEQLIRAVESVESNEIPLAHVILARLNHQIFYPVGKPLQRAAFYFKEALEALIGSRSPISTALTPIETVQKIGAYKAFSELSPIFQFANFTANQAILESTDGFGSIHVIDFDIGLGGQWPSFMQEIAMKCRSAPSVRITAIVQEESVETELTREILCSFAREIGIRFQIEFVDLCSIRLVGGEAVAVNLSPSIFGRIDGTSFLRLLRRISPRIAVFVDAECRREVAGPPWFRRNFIDGLEFYSVLLESMDAAAAGNGGAEQMRRIERFLLRPRIFRSVAAAGNRSLLWKDLFSGAGMSPIPFSEFTESQAACLLRRVPARGFHVAKRQATMMLCWQGRELVATSAWRY
ncbi:scarecrow-like protein 15 [Magnolia sinica]|uniref:scarecrow-like protein 15 n=1 Tax=Magnolia sinica TaxID=86752 RepID=UPI0026598132|nr:scarecrow-like protein 15 [Magnolia sinica]